MNREKFSYDVNEDALYQQYAEQYKRGGKLAMQDTMGQAAAMTGGYGNSYAASVGNQAYQEYMSKLNEVVPELYGMAIDRYQMEGEEMYNQYGLLSDAEQQDYGRYQDEYNKWITERDYATGRYDTESERDYGRYMDDVNIGYKTHTDREDREWNEYLSKVQNEQWGAEFGETVNQHKIANEQWKETMAYNKASDTQKIALDTVYTAIENGVMPSDKDIAAAGLDPKYVQEMYNSYEDKETEANSEKTKAEALDKINTYLSAGMEIPKTLQKQAGLSDNDLKAYTISAAIASGSGDSDEILDLVEKMPTDKIMDMLTGYAEEGDNDAIDIICEDLYLIGRITEEQMKDMKKRYKATQGGGGIDTTVPINGNITGGGGGRITQRAW